MTEIGQIEEQHFIHYESLADPKESWFERLVLNEYNECWLYHSLTQDEPDLRMKKIWDMHLEMEIEHLKIACELMKNHQKKHPEAMLPKKKPTPFKFESNIDYVRNIMAEQTDFNAAGTEFVPGDQLPEDSDYQQYQHMVNNKGVPSEQVIEAHVTKKGKEYRQELSGAHPVERFRK